MSIDAVRRAPVLPPVQLRAEIVDKLPCGEPVDVSFHPSGLITVRHHVKLTVPELCRLFTEIGTASGPLFRRTDTQAQYSAYADLAPNIPEGVRHMVCDGQALTLIDRDLINQPHRVIELTIAAVNRDLRANCRLRAPLPSIGMS